MNRPWFTVCFVPLIPLGSKYKEVHCRICRFAQDIKYVDPLSTSPKHAVENFVFGSLLCVPAQMSIFEDSNTDPSFLVTGPMCSRK